MEDSIEQIRARLLSLDPESLANFLPEVGTSYSAGRFELEEVRPLIESFLDHKYEYLRRTALEVLGSDFLHAGRVERVLDILINDGSDLCRAAAAALLGADFQGKNESRILAALLNSAENDPDLSVRAWCVKAALRVEDAYSPHMFLSDLDDNHVRELVAEIRQRHNI